MSFALKIFNPKGSEKKSLDIAIYLFYGAEFLKVDCLLCIST